MAVCDTTGVLADASCLNCLSHRQLQIVKAVLLCRWLQLLNPDATCDVPTILSAAQQFDGLTTRQIKIVIIQLLCDVLGGGGGGSTWNCVSGVCVDPGDGSGTYPTLQACQAVCGAIPVSYNCVAEGSCVDPGDGTGTYATLAECLAACCEYCGDEFETYALGDVTGDTDLDDGCCWIGAWSLTSDPILAVGIEEFTEYPDGPAGVLNGGTGFTGAWVIP